MTNHRNETPLDDALRRLRDETEVPRLDPKREESLLAAFDAHWARPRRRRAGRLAWMIATAASILIAITLDWLVVRNAPQHAHATPDPVVDTAEFVRWPGADALPPFESGELVRVDLPVSALPALGLWPSQSAGSPGSVVQADVVVGQDGFARAVRLVQ